MTPLLLLGAAVGGAAMYFFDPEQGRRRRTRLQEQGTRVQRRATRVVEQGRRDLANRTTSLRKRALSVFTRRDASDRVLAERVRAKMGRYVAHPGAIEISATRGCVILTGSVLAHEHHDLIAAVAEVPGVQDIYDRLTVFERAEGISELQGGRPRRGERTELMQDNWSPAARLVAGTAGTVLVVNVLRGGIGGLLLGAAGALLLTRAAANKPLRRVTGFSRDGAVDIQKTIRIDAPIGKVYLYLASYENYPRFMRNVRSVTANADGKSHWVVAGPGGTPVEWDSETTQLEMNRLIAWRTTPESAIQHAGSIRLDEAGEGTRVHVRMTYTPPAGVVGHAIAKLLHVDPKTQLDEDMLRLKTLLETGKVPQDAAANETARV